MFIDLVGLTSDGKYVNLSGDATWTSQDLNVATADLGRILAQGKGKTTVTVSYGKYSHNINVTVKNYINIKQKIDEINNSAIQLFSLSASERAQINVNAQAMCDQTWKPSQNVRGWKNAYTFNANTIYKGLPYSQTYYQCNLASFLNYFNDSSTSGFYDNYTSGTTIMPKYGNDCSGFVSFSFGISRHNTTGFRKGISNETFPKVGSYTYQTANDEAGTVITEASKADLLNSYKSLQNGDAVVTNGHTFIVALNMGTYCYCFEQTPYRAQYTTWTYTELANALYKPFSKK